MYETLRPPIFLKEHAPQGKDLIIRFSEEGLQPEGGQLFKYMPYTKKASQTDYSDMRRKVAHTIIANQGEQLSQKQLWEEVCGDLEDYDLSIMNRVCDWLKTIQHNDRFIFTSCKKELKVGSLKKETYHGVSPHFNLFVETEDEIPNYDRVQEIGQKVLSASSSL